MSRTFKRKEVSYSSPRILQTKRPKQALQRDIEEEMKRIRSPLYAWEMSRKDQNA